MATLPFFYHKMAFSRDVVGERVFNGLLLPGCGNGCKNELVYVHKFQGGICALCQISLFFKNFCHKTPEKRDVVSERDFSLL